ncbi:MAG: DUF4149 domain-containing protein [Variovorax sp.]
MTAWNRRWPALVAALWWGSLSTLGLMVVPLLFHTLPSPALAGNTAAHLFTAQTWVSIVCALLLLVSSRPRDPGAPRALADAALPVILLGLLLALLVEFGVAPRIVGRQNLALWHAIGSGMFLLQWLCASAVLWRVLGPAPADQSNSVAD